MDSEEGSSVLLPNVGTSLPYLTLFYPTHQISTVGHVSKLDACLKKKATGVWDATPFRSARKLVTFLSTVLTSSSG